MHKGYFFTIEGGEGAGKTSIITLVDEYLISRGYETLTTREPGGIDIAEQIRSVILDKKNTRMDGRTEALLYAAARRQHLVEKVVPALNDGKMVICDRFVDSSLAYQGYARGLGIQEVLSINNFAIGDVAPDLTLFLDIDPELGLQRIHAHGDREINRLDLESLAFHQRVREGYREVERMFPGRIVKVDASPQIDEVFESVKKVLNRFLEEKA